MIRLILFSSFMILLLAQFSPAYGQVGLFTEISKTCGLESAKSGKFSFGDYDNDGDPDLLINGRTLYRNDTLKNKILFSDVSEEAGLKGAGGGGACWFDFNRDGRLDFVTNSGQVWINEKGNKFTNIKEKLGLKVPNNKAAAIGCGDLNGDGWIDIFTGGGEIWKPFQLFEQTVWINKKGKELVNYTEKAGLHQRQYGRAVIWCDYDWDGDQDIYSGNYRLQPNMLFRNDKGELVDVSTEAGVTGRYDQDMFTNPKTGKKCGYRFGHTIAASWVDLNNDGYFDLWVSNLAHKAIGKVSDEFAKLIGTDFDTRGYDCDDSNLFINQGPPDYLFKDLRQEMGVPITPVEMYGKWRGDELWSNAACADFDNNGWIDVYVNQVYTNQPNSFAVLFSNENGYFRECQKKHGIKLWGGYGSAWADIDSDGKMDLVSEGAPECKGKSGVHLFHNTGPSSDWIGIELLGSKKVQIIGAIVLLFQDNQVMARQVSTSMGAHTQQNDMRIHFGLGAGANIDDLLIYWPDGVIQSLGALKKNRYHKVKKRRLAGPRLSRLTPSSIKRGGETVFKIGLSGKSVGLKYSWDFTGSRSPEFVTENPETTYSYAIAGRYTVCVRAKNKRGGVSEKSFIVTVE